MRRRPAFALLLLAGWAGISIPARAADSTAFDSFALDIKGFIEGRAVLADDTKSWEKGALGKTRFGGAKSGGGVIARGDGALLIEPQFGFDLTGRVVLTVEPEQYAPVSVIEAFLQYKPAPTGNFGLRGKAGFFFPPISLENTALAWTSPYTITSSAINSWVGEELRTVGGEATFFHQDEDLEEGITGAMFTANDPAGTQLTWRGWSFNDREIGLFDRMMIPKVPIIQPTGALFRQAPTEKPFHEIDNRVGAYAAAYLDHADYGKVQLLWYNNNADDHALDKGQWGWRTKFLAAGYTGSLPLGIDLVAQVMKGRTSVITIPGPIEAVDYTEFWSAYGLVSKAWDKHRISFRFDHFVTESDPMPRDNTNEHGNALTFGYNYRLLPNVRLSLEYLHVDSTRPERAALGLPVHAVENQVQASVRLFFSASLP